MKHSKEVLNLELKRCEGCSQLMGGNGEKLVSDFDGVMRGFVELSPVDRLRALAHESEKKLSLHIIEDLWLSVSEEDGPTNFALCNKRETGRRFKS